MSFYLSNKVKDLSGYDFSTLGKANLSNRFIYRLPFSYGITIRGYRFTKNSVDPFIQATKELFSNDRPLERFEKKYFQRLQIEKTLKCSDFGLDESHQSYVAHPSWCMIMPWERDTFTRRRHDYLRLFVQNRSLNSMHFKSDTDIHKLLYSRDLARSQAVQTNNLLTKIMNDGFKETNPLPIVFMLSKDGVVRWIMSDEGNHRAHIAFELGYETLLCRMKSIVRYEDLPKYLAKSNSEYTLRDAKKIFNKAFYGNGPIRGIV
jgi:hypothetical protein